MFAVLPFCLAFTIDSSIQAEQVKCDVRSGMFVAKYTERVGGTCGAKKPLTVYSETIPHPCTGSAVYSHNKCQLTLDYACVFPGRETKTGIEIQRWKNDHDGLAVLLLAHYKDGNELCRSVYDVTYSRP